MSSRSNASSRARPGRTRTPAPVYLARRHVDLLNCKDLDGLMALYADDAILEFPASPVVRGREAIRRALARFFQDWDEVIELHRVIVSGGSVAAEGMVQGRHRSLHLKVPGRVPAAPPRYRHPFAVFWDFERGRIRRHRVYYDARDLVRQLLGS